MLINEILSQRISRICGHFSITVQKPFIRLYSKLKYDNKNAQKLLYHNILKAKQKKYLSRYLYVLSDQPKTVVKPKNKTIWFCWLQGEKDAPPIIDCCLKSLRRYCTDYEIIILTWKNIAKYADIPEYIYAKNKAGFITNTQFSDLLRLALLTKNGGIWIDSTVFLTEPLPREITQADFFAFHSDNYLKSNSWLIKANAGNILLEKLKRLMFEYWRVENKMLDYFLFHIFFDLLVENDEECALIWQKVPLLYDNRYELEKLYFQKYDEQMWQRLKQKSSIHKLSWKYKKQPGAGTFLECLLSGKLN